jgi:ABC-type phosphate transport system substrate-binding protein
VKIKKIIAMSTVAGVALAGLAFASSASAEPVSNSYVLVGSDTLQDSTNALINGTTAGGSLLRVTSTKGTIGSFDAFGSAAIQTKPNGPYFGRPAGSGAGVTALRASITGNPYAPGGTNTTPAKVITGQVDIARSSSGAGSNANANGLLAYVPYARDAVAYAYKGGTAAWANLSAAQLKSVYDGTTTQIDGVTIKPRLPQAGSGTRNFFLPAIGYASGTTVAPGVSDVGNATAENDATVLGAGEIIPFSVASWVAQSNGVTGVSTIGTTGVLLGSPLGSGTPAYTGAGAALSPNAAYYANTSFGRDTYLVVEYARLNSASPKFDAALAALVNPSVAKSLTNFGSFPSTSGSVKLKFGFLAPSSTVPVRAFATL